MKTLPKVVESQAVVRFQDCDPFNHLNNASYLNYFMNHREDMLIKHYNIDIYKMGRQQGKSWVVHISQISYLKSAFLMETVTMQSQVIGISNSNIQVEMRMYNADKTQLKAVMWNSFVHFDLLNQKRTEHSEDIQALLLEVLNPVEAKSFEERVKLLKNEVVLV